MMGDSILGHEILLYALRFGAVIVVVVVAIVGGIMLARARQ